MLVCICIHADARLRRQVFCGGGWLAWLDENTGDRGRDRGERGRKARSRQGGGRAITACIRFFRTPRAFGPGGHGGQETRRATRVGVPDAATHMQGRRSSDPFVFSGPMTRSSAGPTIAIHPNNGRVALASLPTYLGGVEPQPAKSSLDRLAPLSPHRPTLAAGSGPSLAPLSGTSSP